MMIDLFDGADHTPTAEPGEEKSAAEQPPAEHPPGVRDLANQPKNALAKDEYLYGAKTI